MTPTEEALPREIRSFLDRHIDSITPLEILLLLHRTGEPWEAARVADELKTSLEHATAALEALASARLVTSRGEVFVIADDSKLRRLLDDLASLYGTHRVSIITRIFSKPTDSIRSFSDAFRLRRGED